MYALPGVKLILSTQSVLLGHECTQRPYAPLINCVIDDALLESKPYQTSIKRCFTLSTSRTILW